MSDKQDPPSFHYYHACFCIQEAGVTKFISQPVQLQNYQITMPVLAGIRRSMDVPSSGVLIGLNYLGLMTLEEFSPPVRGGMDATTAYLEGLKTGMENASADNPYPVGTVDHLDWRNGRAKGENMWLVANPPAQEVTD